MGEAASRMIAPTGTSWSFRVVDTALDFGVFGFAAWTVIYHSVVPFGGGAGQAVPIAAVFLPLALWFAVRVNRDQDPATPRRVSRPPSAPARTPFGPADMVGYGGRPDSYVEPNPGAVNRPGRHLLTATNIVGALLAALAVGTAIAAAVQFSGYHLPWWHTWAWWMVAAGAATVHALLFRSSVDLSGISGSRGHAEHPLTLPPSVRRTRVIGHEVSAFGQTVVAVCLAAGMGVLASHIWRSNADDQYYVALTTWIAEHGGFPLRDTLYSSLRFPSLFWPPVSSYEPLLGSAAHVTGTHALDLVYLIVPPATTALGTLSLWRLLRTWRTPLSLAALCLALLFLVMDGGPWQSYGNFLLAKMWQGKAVFLAIAVPLLLVQATRFVDHPTRLRGTALAVTSVAAVGMTASAVFLVPMIVLAGILPLVPRAPLRALAGFAGGSVYALGAGVVVLLLGGYTPDVYTIDSAVPIELVHFTLDGELHAGVALFSMLLGALTVSHRTGRLIAGASILVAGVVFAPGVPPVLFEAVGLSRTLWRVAWIVPAAVLVGALGVVLARFVRAFWARGLALALAGALGFLLWTSGTPLWSQENLVEVTPTRTWKRELTSVENARKILRIARPGDTILAPGGYIGGLSVLTPRNNLVAVRRYYDRSLSGVPGFHAHAREYLYRFAQGWVWPGRMMAVPWALEAVGVDVACVDAREPAYTKLREAGYRWADTIGETRCFTLASAKDQDRRNRR